LLRTAVRFRKKSPAWGFFYAYREAKIAPDNLFAFPPSLAVIVKGVSRSGSFACKEENNCSR
jgi:hypothetical protein